MVELPAWVKARLQDIADWYGFSQKQLEENKLIQLGLRQRLDRATKRVGELTVKLDEATDKMESLSKEKSDLAKKNEELAEKAERLQKENDKLKASSHGKQ